MIVDTRRTPTMKITIPATCESEKCGHVFEEPTA